MISHLHELVFFHVPKCAGMSVEQALGGLPEAQRIEQHWGWQTVQRFYPTEYRDYERFAVVRDPLDRAMSMGRFLRRYDPVYRRHLAHVSDRDLLLDLVMGFNVLTQSTADRMLPEDLTVLRFESLADDWRRFAGDYALPEVLPRLNQAPSASTALEPDEQRLLAHVVATAFGGDYDRFGYARPDDACKLSLADRGTVAWTALHTWARSLPVHLDGEAQTAARRFVDQWVEALPERSWRDRFHSVAERLVIDVSGERAVRLWASAVHDAVNASLGRPLWRAWSP